MDDLEDSIDEIAEGNGTSYAKVPPPQVFPLVASKAAATNVASSIFSGDVGQTKIPKSKIAFSKSSSSDSSSDSSDETSKKPEVFKKLPIIKKKISPQNSKLTKKAAAPKNSVAVETATTIFDDEDISDSSE